ncbi:MAG: hypothetical protein HEP71_32105 [Roseivirga sp.]|nr:hypothetical protein [Roseivirga sp.]
MRLNVIVLTFLFASLSLSAQRLSTQEAETKILDYLQQYSSESFDMMTLLAETPNKFNLSGTEITLSAEQSPTEWLDERTEKGIIESLNTVVHETMHGFTSRYAYVLLQASGANNYDFGDDYSAFFLDKDDIYLVKHTEVFTSNKLKQKIPKALRTFRFNPYITPKDNNLGSQIQGIYGLMDEWNAYYHGTKTAYDLFEYYKDKANDNNKVYLEHVSNLAGTYFAYYEFKYYILKYLELAKSDYPDVYKGIMANTNLRKAYTDIDNHFSALLGQFEERLDTIENLVTSDNYTSVHREDGYYFIGSNGVGLFSEEAEMLKKELSISTMRTLDQELRVK